MITPRYSSATEKASYDLNGFYRAVLLTDIVSAGSAQYLFILKVCNVANNDPELFVTSESNQQAKSMGFGSHSLRVFQDDVQVELGPSNNWANIEKFTDWALTIAKGRLAFADERRSTL